VGDERRNFYLTFVLVPYYYSPMKYTLDKGNHSIYSLQFHYVACVKYRQKILVGNVADRLKVINLNVAKAFGITINEQETAIDHIHILFSSKPQIQLSKFVNSLKSVSARLLFREFSELKKSLWKGHFWSSSYFLVSTGQVTLEDLKRYVENQNL
jgi:putative transposase